MDFTVICRGLQGLSLRFWVEWDISISHIAALRCQTGLFCPSARLNFSQGDLDVIMSASLNVADCTEIHIRLVQFKPAWTIHCLLRFKNLPYLCENTCSKDSLGLKVPLLIDGNFVFAERLAIEHLSMDRQTRAADGDYPPNAASIFDTEHNQFLLADKIMSDHIEVALLLVHEQLESILESIAKKGVCGLSVPAIVFGKLRSFIKSFDIDSEKVQKYPECDVEDLLIRLDEIYTELNSTLERNKGFLISISVVSPTMVTASSNIILGGQTSITKSRGTAEALLFGHLTEALSNPMTSHLLLKHLALLAFVRNILEEYFLTPLRSPKNTLRTSLWEDSTQCILENRLFLEMNPSTLTDSLLSPLCPPSPNGFQGVNPARRTMTDRYTNQNINNYNNKNNSQNISHISSSFTTPKKIMSSPPRNATFKRNSLPSPPSMSPIRTCAPRTVISPRTHTSPRCKMTLRSPVKHFLFDIDGTQKSQDEIMWFRDVGPSTIIDKRTEYCGRYLLLPALLKNYFPLLSGNRGSIRISGRNPVENNVIIVENEYDEIPKSDDKDDSDSDSDSDDEIGKSPINNADIEISSLGAVFIMAVSGIFLLNIVTGSS